MRDNLGSALPPSQATMTEMESMRMPTTAWRKSSYSQDVNSDCVEVAWRKSSYSDGSVTSDCVEVAFGPEVFVRDSKDPGVVLAFGPEAWRQLIATRRRFAG